VQGSVFKLFQTVLHPNNGAMLIFRQPSHEYDLPHVGGTKVGLPHLFGRLRQGKFGLVKVDWGLAIGTAQTR
jgi:hypothetical protein